ncbi:c-type cytochrome [Roseinatronobacter sp.]|uniref:c-type cytochrome n=1 Tax=Roseinatronobacter sp. TaxID=1945755 RepID=UPI0025E2CD2C|nr:cytochrome c [Roseibaca sp.]
MIRIFAIASLLAISACSPTTSPQAGRSLFAQNCVQCHGANATGGDTVPDLTGLALRAGGTYPQTMVLDKLDGYARGQAAYAGVEMPQFGYLLTGPLTRVPMSDGMSRQLPEKIVALDSYLRSLQRSGN